MPGNTGTVTILGAGPGDPELLTLKAARVLREAQVVVHDRLVGEGVMAMIAPEAERIYSGKSAKEHKMTQDEINATLADIAQSGRDVVRLKGGDPFIFGRGGEEALYLAERGIPFDIIPGVSAAQGCAAAAGIPLTHRTLATSVRFITGHCKGNTGLEYDWHSLAQEDTTLVIFMGLANAAIIRDRLIGAGLPASTPAALIQEGTTHRARTHVTTLDALPYAIKTHNFQSPTLIIIGKVADVCTQLAESDRGSLVIV